MKRELTTIARKAARNQSIARNQARSNKVWQYQSDPDSIRSYQCDKCLEPVLLNEAGPHWRLNHFWDGKPQFSKRVLKGDF